MARVSSPITRLKAHYPVVVIGSGYGGAIAAARLACAGQQVCVLERGRELQPGDYPDSPSGVLREIQVDTPAGHFFSPTGLYDFRANDEINVFVGCGLGGTSLINANVFAPPTDGVFREGWPGPLHKRGLDELAPGFRLAQTMLQPTSYPGPAPLKLRALEQSAPRQNPPPRFSRPLLNVTFQEGPNHVGIYQYACRACGDCMAGCNYGAKNTVLMNYLPYARQHGAQMYTEIGVRYLEWRRPRWLVHCELLGSGRAAFGSPPIALSADLVVLAAGTLGSTEILLRSQERGLRLSPTVGRGFSGNGDVLAFGYNADPTINGVGAGRYQPDEHERVGPCITGFLDLRGRPELKHDLVIEEGSIPGVMGAVVPTLFSALALFSGRAHADDRPSVLGREARRVGRRLSGSALRHTQTFLVMGHDGGDGTMRLKNDRLRIEWPGLRKQEVFARVNPLLQEANSSLRGIYLDTVSNQVIVHPLGGCRMADCAENGVVNHEGRVFCEREGPETYDTLYVCDGSVVPRPLGVNPLLTIAALAERTVHLLIRSHVQLPAACPGP